MGELTEAERLGCDPREIVEWPWTTASPGRYVRTETAARIKADTHAAAYDKGHAAGVAEGRAEVVARVEALAGDPDRRYVIRREHHPDLPTFMSATVRVADLLNALAGTSPQGEGEHTHGTGGAWHVTRWQVPGCPACASESDYRDDATAIGDSTGYGGPVESSYDPRGDDRRPGPRGEVGRG